MILSEMMCKRKSTRKYLDEKLDENIVNDILNFACNLKRLNKNINTNFKLISSTDINYPFSWRAPYYIAIFSEKKDNYLENIGFMFEQLDLYIQSLGLASCWLGLGEYTGKKDNNLDFIIMMSFGKALTSPHRSLEEFNRIPLNKITDKIDTALNSVRLAPSSVNSQPWYFMHNEKHLDVYCKSKTDIPGKDLSIMNKIDIGIALCFLYIENTNTFKYFITSKNKKIDDYYYICSVQL